MYFNGKDTKIVSCAGERCGSAGDPSPSAAVFTGDRPRDYLTVMVWIKPDDVVAGQMLVMLGRWGWGVMLMCPTGSGKGCCGTHAENAIGFWSTPDPTPSSCAEQLSSDVGIERGVWSHVAVVVDETQDTNDVSFYINGVPAGHRRSDVLGAINAPRDEPNAQVVVGQGPCPAGCLNYKGHMDDIGVYNAIWTEDEIATWAMKE